MVSPDDKPNRANGNHGIGHTKIAKHGLAGECRNNVADNAEAGKDKNINFRMAEEPEQMLEQDRIATA